MPARLLLFSLSLALVAATAASGQTRVKISPNSSNSYARFGEDVALDGKTFIVGSRWDNSRGSNAGAAYIFAANADNVWSQRAKLSPGQPRPSEYFGSDVGISGNVAIIGASGSDAQRGAAYIFTRGANGWAQSLRLTPTGDAGRSSFGSTVAVDGRNIVVGAPDHTKGNVRAGAIYIYGQNDGGGWALRSRLFASDPRSVSNFGSSVAVSGDWIVVGTPGDNTLSGSVYVFRKNGQNWSQHSKLRPNGGAIGDGFGQAVAVDNGRIYVGAPQRDRGRSNSGVVYVFRQNDGGRWNQEAVLQPSDPRVSKHFGWSIAPDDGRVAIGAPGDRNGGSVYFFQRGQSSWVEVTKLNEGPARTGASFGQSVVLSDNLTVIAADNDDGSSRRSGSVFLYGDIAGFDDGGAGGGGGGDGDGGGGDGDGGGGDGDGGGGDGDGDGGGGDVDPPPKHRIDLFGVAYGSAAWGDFDGDGLMDLAVAGAKDGVWKTSVYKNAGDDKFDEIVAPFEQAESARLAWVDFDDDGDLDLAITGQLERGRVTVLYQHEDSEKHFVPIPTSIPGVVGGGMAWGDYDNDGDEDLLICGERDDGIRTKLYRAQAIGRYVSVATDFVDVRGCHADWGDFDEDGDLDLLLAGMTEAREVFAGVYQNDSNGAFTLLEVPLNGILGGAARWIDVDRDGKLDVFLTGGTMDGEFSGIYKNDGDGSFSLMDSGLPPLSASAGDWGDYDHDGDLDLLLTGWDGAEHHSGVYKNDGDGDFIKIDVGLDPVSAASVGWADYDLDGSLDILLAGISSEGRITRVYRNESGIDRGDALKPPVNLDAGVQGRKVVLTWDENPDDTYPGPTFNLRVGSTPGGIDIVNPQTSWSERLQKPESGNTGPKQSWALSNLPPGRYYWTVQAVDLSFATSPFAPERAFVVGSDPNEFVDMDAQMWGARSGFGVWGDFNSDGQLDALVGGTTGIHAQTTMYSLDQKQQTFVSTATGLPNMIRGKADVADYDNDGDLDIVICGLSAGGPVTDVFKNDGHGSFTNIGVRLESVTRGHVQWADINNDGLKDILLAGKAETGSVTLIYRNSGQDSFEQVEVDMPGLYDVSADWGDSDSDGDLDLVIAGYDGSKRLTMLYRNLGSWEFERLDTEFAHVSGGSVKWIDFDGDGRQDVVVSGVDSTDQEITQLYLNRSDNRFNSQSLGFIDNWAGHHSWGDADADGDSDLLFVGGKGESRLVGFFVNERGILRQAESYMPLLDSGFTEWGDVDGDDKLDILLAGIAGRFGVAKVLRNTRRTFGDDPPPAPESLRSVVRGDSVFFSWDASANGGKPISFNIRVGTSQYSGDVVSGESNEDGTRLLVAGGNVGSARSWALQSAPHGRLYWSVQSVDQAFRGSEYAQPATFWVGDEPAPFVKADIDLPALEDGSATWIDFDGDGDDDISMHGSTGSTYSARIFVNYGGGVFRRLDATLPGVVDGEMVWEDYDNDGDQDVLITGMSMTEPITRIFRNDALGVFTDIDAGLPGLEFSSASWGDFDKDGDPDVVILGSTGEENVTLLYRNQGEDSFVETTASFIGVMNGSADWSDVARNGKLDLIVTGLNDVNESTVLYVNRPDIGDPYFVTKPRDVPSVHDGVVMWVDYDGDGWDDLLITGNTLAGPMSLLMHNTRGGLSDSGIELPALSSSAADWGDFDGDGDIDLAMTGQDDTGRKLVVGVNNGSGDLDLLMTGIDPVTDGSISWGDYDGDGDLDLLVVGDADVGAVATVYQFEPVGESVSKFAGAETIVEAETTSELPPNGHRLVAPYPNPFLDRATLGFTVGRDQAVRVDLYNVVGQRIMSVHDGYVLNNKPVTLHIDGSGISSGVYLLHVAGETFQEVVTIVLNK